MPAAEPPPPNYDETVVGRLALPDVLERPVGWARVRTAEDREDCRRQVVALFARRLYGDIPPPPEEMAVAREPVRGEPCARLTIALAHRGRRLAVDAALWLPPAARGPVPVIAGLTFLGPAGAMLSESFPIDEAAVVDGREEHGVVGRRLTEAVRGQHLGRWPAPLILAAGFGLALTCYGSWTPDDPALWEVSGLASLLGPDRGDAGALSLWAFSALRLADALARCPEVDASRIVLAGHSRLGKAALWAAANEPGIAGAIVNNSGCAGAAPSRRNFGETLAHLVHRYPHWLAPAAATAAADPASLPVDQHQLLGCIAPRPLYVASAAADLWADPEGERLAVAAAAPLWDLDGHAARLAWHLRPGGHNLTPWDWRRFLPFLKEQLAAG
jgi:hypothetical protein